MRITGLFTIVALLAAVPGPAVASPLPQQSPPPQRTQASASTIQTRTRLITVDVVVTDSHGKPVRGMTQNDFEVSEEHSGKQTIAKFRFVDSSANTPALASASLPSGAHVYSNQPFDKLTAPPSILLMDALNTEIQQQSEVHRHMLMLLKTLPATTPVAVFVLGHTLHVVQGFTTDPALLRAAVDKTLRAPDVEQNPQDDANSSSNVALDLNGNQETPAVQGLEDFEAMVYESQMAIRVDETTDAMVSIAKYLGGYPGRKNLLWFSAAFPNWIAPSADFGSDAFSGSATYADKIREAYETLTDAQVAVYPVDAQGLETSQLYSTAQNPHINRANPGAGFGSQLNRDSNLRLSSQATMEQIAEETGGKPCENTNDLSGCVQSALNDSSVYYELAYYPENIRWDGRFHRIVVKSNQHGTKLRYRTGYFATDPATLAKQQTPEKLLKQACIDPLPSTAIPLAAEAVAPTQSSGEASASVRYLLTISPGALSLAPVGDARSLNVQMAICEYDSKGNSFQFYPRDLTRPVSDSVYQDWQAHGIRDIFDYEATPDGQRVRFAVLDVPSGTTGAVDVPARPREFASEPGHVVPAASSASAPSASAAASTAPKAPVEVITQLKFRVASGALSLLDWSGDKLWYHGDLGINQGAPAFFKTVFAPRYHCDAGKLISNDASSTTPPSYLLTFHSPSGPGALVDLGGEAPAYSGNLPVDASAKAFFDYVWKLCHCQQP
jgi:VWFA-related protein